MKLKEYFERNCVNVKAFQRKCGISMNTLYKAMQGKEVYLSVALRIEDATEGKVRCQDMRPLQQYMRNKGGSVKQVD